MSNSLRYRERTAEVTEQMRKLRQSQPELLSAFGALGAAGTKDGALTKKTRELVALGIAISCRCDDCIGFHMQSLIKLKGRVRRSRRLLVSPSTWGAAHR